MSASQKKKLRKAKNAAQMTEKQLKEKQEAKKLKTYTIIFTVVMALIVTVALGTVIGQTINKSGILDRNTHALTIDQHELTSAELNYFYMDSINQTYSYWYSMYGQYTASYLPMLGGPDLKKPLSSQTYDKEKGTTWGDYFVDQAIDSAKSTYALYDLAVKEGHQLTEEQRKTLDESYKSMEKAATKAGYKNVTEYLKASYGFGSTEETYKNYCEVSTLAQSYYAAHQESLEYTDKDYRDHEKDKYKEYSSYSYVSFLMQGTDFLGAKEKDENGKEKDYTAEQRESARKAAEEAAKAIAGKTAINSQLLLDKELKAMDQYKDKKTLSSVSDRILYNNVNSTIREWVTDDDRKEGDITYIPYTSKTTDKDGKETEVVNGYYIVIFTSSTDNKSPLANVRHLLVKFEGGTTKDGKTTYSDAEKAKAKEEAEKLLKEWKDGKATEESFAELAKKHSDDTGSKENGGLLEDITPDTSYVENFLNWCIAEHKAGDTEIVETEYGYHIMYYVGDDEMTYRDFMIENDLITKDMEAWYESVLKPVTVTRHNLSRLNTDIILAGY